MRAITHNELLNDLQLKLIILLFYSLLERHKTTGATYMNKFLKYILILLTLVLIAIPLIYGVLVFKTSQNAFEKSYSKDSSNHQSQLRKQQVDPSKEPISILFLGIDENEVRKKKGQSTEQSRTDAMILATFNPEKDQIRMFSFPRDTISYIPKVGYYDKITHAHAYGGPLSSMNTIEATMNVPVDYYLRVNMEAFVDTVNEMGGIYFDVPYNLDEPNSDDSGRIKVKKGYQKLNGDQALAVARTRHQDSDLKRGQRQMALLKALYAKAQNTDSLDKLDRMIEIVGDNASHNLTYKEIKALASDVLQANGEIKSAQLKGEDDYLNGIYYYNPSLEQLMKASNMLRNDLGLSKIEDEDEFLNARVINFYGSLVPLTPIDESLLDDNQQDQDGENDDTQSTGDEGNGYETNNDTDAGYQQDSAPEYNQYGEQPIQNDQQYGEPQTQNGDQQFNEQPSTQNQTY